MGSKRVDLDKIVHVQIVYLFGATSWMILLTLQFDLCYQTGSFSAVVTLATFNVSPLSFLSHHHVKQAMIILAPLKAIECCYHLSKA